MIERPYSYLVDSILPEYIIDQYPQYVEFIKQYFQAIESDTGPAGVLNSLMTYIDVNVVPEELLIFYVRQYLSSFPTELLNKLDVAQFIKNAKSFYSEKGNENSIRFIFNLLGATLQISYPSTKIFRTNISLLSGTEIAVDGYVKPDHLHDNVYYAYYVYEINTDIDIGTYRDLLFSTVHPAGMKLFSNKIITAADNNGDLLSMDMQLVEPVPMYLEFNTFLNTRLKAGLLSNSAGTISNNILLSGTLESIFVINKEFGSVASYLIFYSHYLDTVEDLFGYTLSDFEHITYNLFTEGLYPMNNLFVADNIIPLSIGINNTDKVNVQRSAYLEITT